MAEIHMLKIRPSELIAEALNNLASEIDEIVCVVKLKDGTISCVDSNASFEFKCTAIKLLDFELNEELKEDNEEED